MLWIAKHVLNVPVDPETTITIEASDGYIDSDETRRARDRQEVLDGLMQRWEYRVKWYGEDEETAKRMTQNAPTFGGMRYLPGEDGV